MLNRNRHSSRGFTLIELAIVLAIAGLLFVGLWRLLSGGNTQLRDQSAAAQQQQLIAAVKAYLASPGGATYMTANAGCGGNCGVAPFALPLPSAANAPDGGANTFCHGDGTMTFGAGPNTNAAGFCDFLPPGFSQSTANSYGQNFYLAGGYPAGIRILRDATPAGNAPHTYSFMIVTQGGDPIPDTSGGRVTAIIGGDGGFIYSSVVCTTNPAAPLTSTACGTYGAWAVDIRTYGYPDAATNSGHIATRTFITPEQDSLYPWLARPLLPSDAATPNTPTFNTMQTDMLMGGKTLFFGSDKSAAAGGNTTTAINMQGGVISGVYTANTSPAINLSASGASSYMLLIGIDGMVASNPAINVTTGCTQDAAAAGGGFTYFPSGPAGIPPGCPAGIQVLGDVNVAGQANANSLFARTFIYQSSDFRLKKNIVAIKNPLDNIMKLNPVSFDFKASGASGLGVIAQDMEKIYPQLVSNRSDGYKAVNYEGLIAPLIGAVQELKHENDRMAAQIHEQAQRQQQLEKELHDAQKP